MRIRTGHAPDAWSENVPSRAYSPVGRHDPRPAVTIADMRPLIHGTVLSGHQDRSVDGAHAIADARLRQAYSIHPENRHRKDDAA